MAKKEVLQEIIRNLTDLIEPKDHSFFLKTLTTSGMQKYYDKHPKCFIKHNDHLFPICGQHGKKCIKMMSFAIKLVKKHGEDGNIDPETISKIVTKLERLKKKYSSHAPKSVEGAILKAKSTRQFNKNMR